jgi:phenylacetate-CoA ligase
MHMPTYEEIRRRHVQDALPKAGELIARIQWPADKLAAHRRDELRELVRTAQAASPWHRKRLADLNPDTLDEDTLAELPVMTKDDLIANFDDIVTDDRLRRDVIEAHLSGLGERDAYLFDRYHACASGGSSGRRGVFVYDWDAWILVYFGIIRFLLRDLMAMPKGPTPPRLAMVAAGNATHMTNSCTQTFSTPNLLARRFPVTMAMDRIVAGLNDYQPTVLAAYASALPLLTREVEAGRLRISPRYVLSTSEPLLPEIRQAVERAWGLPALNYYASSETGALGISCGKGPGPHLADDLTIVEPVDELGRPVVPGQRAAKIYVTNLYNHTLPLIRYEITDEVTLLDEPCPCGSAQRLIADPQGRLDDCFRYGDVVVHPHVFRSPLARQRAVVEYQVRQTPRGADVLLRCDGPLDAAALRAAIAADLAKVGLASPDVSVSVVGRIGRQDTGKLRRFIAHG